MGKHPLPNGLFMAYKWLEEIRQANQLREVGSWNPIISQGFQNIQTVVGLGISEPSTSREGNCIC